MKFSHSGAIGDIIYHLAVVEYLGGGEFYIMRGDRNYNQSKEGLQFQSLKPLLDIQPYIKKCEWADSPTGINMDGWRRKINWDLNLTMQMADFLCCCTDFNCDKKWIYVEESKHVADVIISRGSNINYELFPWREIVRQYGKKAVFIGTYSEYCNFVKDYGYVPYYATASMLDVAHAINGSKLAVCGGSAVAALCEGMKHRMIVSSHPAVSNAVNFSRPDLQHCHDKVDFWEV